jgi:hypothetical protein
MTTNESNRGNHAAISDVRFTPESGHSARHRAKPLDQQQMAQQIGDEMADFDRDMEIDEAAE